MNFFNRLAPLIIITVCLTTALPILAAIALAQHQALDREQNYVASLARQALAKAEATGQQLGAGSRLINALPPSEVCSEKGLDVMRRIDLSSTLIQAVGHVDGNVMTCSSLGGTRQFDLGAPDMQSSLGATIRTHVKLLDPDRTYVVVGTGSFVGIVHGDLPLSFVESVPGLGLAAFNWSNRKLILQRGQLDPQWIKAGAKGDVIFRSGNHIVAIARSRTLDLGGIAALPLSHSSGFVREAVMVLAPLGLVTGLALSALLLRVMRDRTSMPAMIRQALKADEFHLVYQPVVELATGRTVGAEALIRWRRSGGEYVPPDIFIPIAEQSGHISMVTRRVLDLLAEDAPLILRLLPCFHFAVNFAAADMHRANIVDEVAGFLTKAGVPNENLVIEATERSLVNVDLAKQTMGRLRSTGVKVAIDDFGTGYSSLSYLAQLDLDFLKIDKLFVHALGTGSATSHVAGRIIEMAKDLNLKLIAEGIETNDQARLLGALDVQFAQGYFYGRPMPLDDLLERLRAERYVGPQVHADAAA